ncbi:AI-2E family transporter [Comamonas testosteroni]
MRQDSATPSPSPSAGNPSAGGVADAPQPWRPPPVHWGVRLASYLLMGFALLIIMLNGLLVGLLAACVGYTFTQFLVRKIADASRQPLSLHVPPARWIEYVAVTIVLVVPIVLVTLGLIHSQGYLLNAPQQYRDILESMAKTLLDLRSKLPPELANVLPDGAQELQQRAAEYLGTKAGTIANMGRSWLAGLLYVFVGLLIGSLAAVRHGRLSHAPLAHQLQLRVQRFGDAFRQIVAAQFWIALFNTVLTAIFLLGILPLLDMRLPYSGALIMLTFFGGLIPIVGNLVCNAVITTVGLSVSPLTAVACLAFLVLIHKAEYLINAKVVGAKTHMGVWELLSVMFVAEAIFGPAGLVAAPLFYAYLKKELFAARLI